MKGLSVVIATLGGNCLEGTINKLNNGTVVPDEILICIPKRFAHNVSNLNHKNALIIETDCKGQVAQRAIGFKIARFDLVLQLDDDLLVNQDCVKKLVDCLEQLPKNSVVAPQYFYNDSNLPFHQKPSNDFLLRIYYFLINGKEGYKQGVITKAGTPIGCTFNESDGNYKQSQWLPGGCVLHYKNNLLTHNFFPLVGKAYCEDLFHSMILKGKGICFYVVKEAYIGLEEPEVFGIKENLKSIVADYRSRKIFLKSFKENRSILRMHLYYLLNFKRHLIRKSIFIF
jgi:GT2 family glycosyltransferase